MLSHGCGDANASLRTQVLVKHAFPDAPAPQMHPIFLRLVGVRLVRGVQQTVPKPAN